MEYLKISEISIEPISIKDGHLGFVSFVVNESLKICNVGIHSCPSSSTGIRLVFPKRQYKTIQMDTVFPINQAAYAAIVSEVSVVYLALVEKLN